MPNKEILIRIIPLIILLVGLSLQELSTGEVSDRILLMAAIYFLAVGVFLRSKPWWHYPLGMLSILILFLGLNILVTSLTCWYAILGGGAMKLLAVMGAALGVVLALKMAGIFLMILVLFHVSHKTINFDFTVLPSVPFIALSVVLVYLWQYRSLFLSGNASKDKKSI